jgi:hypothetical protein
VRRVALGIVTITLIVLVAPHAARAAFTPNGTEYRKLAFPVREPVHYFDDFGGVRNHPGNDLMGAKLDHLLAANDGTITFARSDSSGNSGNMLILTGTDGWKYWYIHINNDTPGTDDAQNPARWRFAPGITLGSHVTKGQFIAYMGDSGQAETTDPHLHFELHRPDDTYIDPYTSLRLAQGYGANGLCALPSNPVAHPKASSGRGFWTLGPGGKVLAFGNVQNYGKPPATTLDNVYVAIAATPTGDGYWVVNAKGAVRAFGDAHAYGGMQNRQLNAPIIGMTRTQSGHGYWLLARDGGIFTFGDAAFHGSTGNKVLNSPVISMGATPGGNGYWLLAGDGGIFTFGDAHFYGSTGGQILPAPVVAMNSTPTGKGYWLVDRNGGIYRFGDAHDFGDVPGLGWCPGPAALVVARTTTAQGYWIPLSDGRVVAFGDAKAWGQPVDKGSTHVTALAAAV